MSDNNIKRCPECGYPDVYMGVQAVECGYVSSCPNWTKEQAREVDRLNAERYPEPDYNESEESESYTGPFQFSLNYDDDDDTPTWSIPDFVTTD